MKTPQPGQIPEASGVSSVIQTRRNYAPNESSVATPTGSQVRWWRWFWDLPLFYAGYGFWIPLALAAFIFLFGGAVVISRGEPIFTLMYFMFVIVGAGGLMVTANLSPIAKDLKIDTIRFRWRSGPCRR